MKVSKEDYYKLKCEEWFNDRNFIVYGMFATDREYIPLIFEGIYTKRRTRIENVDSWEELYERKREALGAVITGSYAKAKEEKDIEELKVNMFSSKCYINQLEDKINELIREVNKLKNKGE